MKKVLSLLLALALAFDLAACGGAQATPPASSAPAAAASDSTLTDEELDALGDVQVEKELFDVKIVIPSDFVDEDLTQEALDAEASEDHFQKATLNSDGSVTYVMSKRQHKAMLRELSSSIRESLDDMVGTEDYPAIKSIEANDSFTHFTVTTASTELTMAESFSVIGFYMFGGLYNIYSGEAVEEIRVDFVNADTGELIESASTADMAASPAG